MRVEQIRFTAQGEVDVVAVEEDLAPAADEVVIAPARVGICGSDLHLLHGSHPFVQPPVITGHEVSGTVVQVGGEVASLTPGQRVLVNPLFSCGYCEHCRRQQVNQCEAARVLGFKLPGAARTRVVFPERQVHPVPDSVSTDAACLAEPLSAGYHAVRRIESGGMEDVLVFGGGPIGLCVLLAAKALGAKNVTVVEPVAAKRELALELGARGAVTPEAFSNEQGRYTAVLDCAGTPEALHSAVEHSVAGGIVVMVGLPGGQPELPLARMQRFEVDLLGSGLYTPGEVDAAIRLIADGTVDPTPLVSASYELSEAAVAYRVAAEPSQVKVLIRLNR